MLILICGLPSAGKTTYSSRYDNVIHFDRYRNDFGRCNKDASMVIGDVCVEGVYNSVRRRKELLDVMSHHDRKVCVWLDTPLDECVRREKADRRRPLGLIYAHHESFEMPTPDEGWDEVIVI